MTDGVTLQRRHSLAERKYRISHELDQCQWPEIYESEDSENIANTIKYKTHLVDFSFALLRNTSDNIIEVEICDAGVSFVSISYI